MRSQLARRVPAAAWRAAGAWRRHAWPYCIVAFHRVADDGEGLSYPPAAFAELCRYWRDHYELLTLDSVLARLVYGDAAAGPALCITFDDGYADNAAVAAGILDRLGLNATFFITAGAIGESNSFPWDQHLPTPPPMMSWEQVRTLHAAGFGIGSHTYTHARISQLSPAVLAFELGASRRRLEDELKASIVDFAYPFGGLGDCDAAARAAVREAGYRCCLACHGGLVDAGDSPYALNRICISPRWHANPRAWARAYARVVLRNSTTARAFAYQ